MVRRMLLFGLLGRGRCLRGVARAHGRRARPLTATAGGGGAALPAAAARRLEIGRLEVEHARLAARGEREAARSVRKALGALQRSAPAGPPVPTAVATFYAFTPVEDPAATVGRLDAALRGSGSAMGTVTVAAEGANGALAVPVAAKGALAALLARAAPELFPTARAAAAALNWDAAVADDAPFHALKVRSRAKCLADGLAAPLDWADGPAPLAADAWEAAIARPGAIVLDVRNAYESALGTFDAATPLGTAAFVETFARLDEILADAPRDGPVRMFCTGGVRCVKAGAYVKQALGFSDVRSLDQGVVGYDRWRKDAAGDGEEAPPSTFAGETFVFDKRADV